MAETAPVLVSMGDPAGIGPEIIVKALAGAARPLPVVVVGDARVMARAVGLVAPDMRIDIVTDPLAGAAGPGVIRLVESGRLDPLPGFGRIDAAAARAAVDAVLAAVRLVQAGRGSAIVTAPINKAALALAGLPWPGHTELLAAHAGRGPAAMMLAGPDLRVVPATLHMALAEAVAGLDHDTELAAIRAADQGARAFGIPAPRVAVAALNPHAGDGGRFGDAEARILAPAIAAARAEGIDASGPWPADTVFLQARRGRFDVVVARYHDQAMIPAKLDGLDAAVNVTLGLDLIRTSPDHGTAFDIAGRGIADPAPLLAAIACARRLCPASSHPAAPASRQPADSRTGA